MTMKKHSIPAFLLTALIAVSMVFTMGVTVQNAYADSNASTTDEYEIYIEGMNDMAPGDTVHPEAVLLKDGVEVELPEGTRIEWWLGELGQDGIKERYIIPKTKAEGNRNSDKYVQVMQDDTTKAEIVSILLLGDDPVDATMGLTAALMQGDKQIATSDSNQFRFASEFNSVEYSSEGIDPNLLSGETQNLTVTVTRHESGGVTEPLEVRYVWALDNEGVQILYDGNPVTEQTGTNLTFTFKRIDSSIESEPELTIYDGDDNAIESICFPFYAIPNDLADYQIEFNDQAEEPIVFIDQENLPVEEDSEACKITVVSGNGDGHVLPKEAYDLKVKKVIGYNEKTWKEITEDASFPLDVDPKNSFDLNGNRTDGTALYLITAVAKSDHPYYKGKTNGETGTLYLIDRKTIVWPATYVGFPDKKYNDNQSRYEVKKGKKLTPFVTSVENTSKNLVLNKDYTVKYINKKTKKVYSSFPTKLGEYSVIFYGKSPYYGQQDGIDLLVGKKNTINANGQTVICKTKMKKGKTKKAKYFKASDAVKVKKAKGTVSYVKYAGSDRITISENGKLKVKKGTKKGKYKIRVEVTAQGTSKYIAGSNKVIITVKVK